MRNGRLRRGLGMAWAALLVVALAVPGPAAAAPKAELWARWTAHEAESVRRVDHSAWDGLLARRLSEGRGERAGIALFDYAAVTAADREALRGYLQSLADTPVAALNRDEQVAFWINLYNALTVEVVLAQYPVDSILDIGGGFLARGPWDDEVFAVNGVALSLNDIEHRILRPIWQDARIHYAVNCASLGCPNVAARAWTAETAEAMFEAAAREYVNHPRGAAVRDGALVVSSIYEWYREDFGGSDAEVIAHLRRYAGGELRAALEGVTVIADDVYDWSLNERR